MSGHMRRFQMLSARSQPRLGVVITSGSLAAVEIGRGWRGSRARRTWIRPLEPYVGGADWPDLADALEELAKEIGACGQLFIALTRPLARTKVVYPPPVAARDRLPLIVRNVRRYIIADTGPLLTDAVHLVEGDAGRSRALIACVSADLANAVWKSTQAAGWRLEVMTTATVALVNGAARLLPDSEHSRYALVASCKQWREAIVVENGEPVSIEAWSQLSAIDCQDQACHLAEEMGAKRILLEDPAEDTREDPTNSIGSIHPAAVAAFGVATLRRRPPLFLPEAERSASARRSRRRAFIQIAAALVLLILAQQAYLIGLERELSVVREQRETIAPAVNRALSIRASADTLSRRLVTIDMAQESTWRWSPVVAALARELPDSVYLLSLSGRGADLHLTGVAPSASEVIPALASSRMFASVALESPVQRVPRSGEKFELGVNVASSGSGHERPIADSVSSPGGS